MVIKHEQPKTPEENYEDAALELALYRMLQHEHEMVKADSSEDDEKETQHIAAESTSRIFALIERHTKRRDGNSFKRQSARFLKAVACVVLVANMGLTIATATTMPSRTAATRKIRLMVPSIHAVMMIDTRSSIGALTIIRRHI